MNNGSSDKNLLLLLLYVLPVLGPMIVLANDSKRDLPLYKQHTAQAFCYGVFTLILGAISSVFLIIPLALWLIGCYWGYQASHGQPVTIPLITDFVRSQGWA